MKPRRALLLSLTVVLALCAACGLWLHRERQQYALNRQLIAALEHNDAKQALALVNTGADPNTRFDPPSAPTLTEWGQQLLHQSPPPTNDSPTAFLLACKANVYPKDNGTQEQVSDAENLSLVQTMLENGANIHLRTFNKQTASDVAASWNDTRLAVLLLKHGADINAQDEGGGTPLMTAVKHCHREMTLLLLAHGAKANVQDINGLSALHWALVRHMDGDIIRQLLTHDANPNLHDRNGNTPLQQAQWECSPDLVHLLKQHGAK